MTQTHGESQGRGDTTETERFYNEKCNCTTYSRNLGPCKTFELGSNNRCAYCDHSFICHESLLIDIPDHSEDSLVKIAMYYKKMARNFEEALDNVREALGQESTHYLIIASDVEDVVKERDKLRKILDNQEK